MFWLLEEYSEKVLSRPSGSFIGVGDKHIVVNLINGLIHIVNVACYGDSKNARVV